MTFLLTQILIITFKVFIHLFHELKPRFQEVCRILIQLYVQMIQLTNPLNILLADLGPSQAPVGLVQLMKRLQEMEVKSALEQILGHLLVLAQPEKGHPAQVLLGAGQHEHVAVALRHGGHVVATDESEVGQHASLSVGGQVGVAVHELVEGDIAPVLSNEALGELLDSGGAALAKVAGGLPGCATLYMPELAQEAGHRLTEKCNIKISGKNANQSYNIISEVCLFHATKLHKQDVKRKGFYMTSIMNDGFRS